MAKPPIAAAEDAAPAADVMGAGMPDAGAEPMPDDADAEGDSGTVLLTVCKEGDGTYSLIEGDEEDAPAPEDGAPDTGAGKTFDSKGALLKAILDILNKDETGGGEGGGEAEADFQSGFGGPGAPPAAPMPQKY